VGQNRLLLTKLTRETDDSLTARFMLYQFGGNAVVPDLDAKILGGDADIQGYHTMDVEMNFMEIPEGDSFYPKFTYITLVSREDAPDPPAQETDYSIPVARDEIKSLHGLTIGMPLEEAKKLLNLPESAYNSYKDENNEYTNVTVDGWHYTFYNIDNWERANLVSFGGDGRQYLVNMGIREYLGVFFRDIKLGDPYKDVLKKFPVTGNTQTPTDGTPGNYSVKTYYSPSTNNIIDLYVDDVHVAFTFGRYDTLAWTDVYSIAY
jgi:hypothetical protein